MTTHRCLIVPSDSRFRGHPNHGGALCRDARSGRLRAGIVGRCRRFCIGLRWRRWNRNLGQFGYSPVTAQHTFHGPVLRPPALRRFGLSFVWRFGRQLGCRAIGPSNGVNGDPMLLIMLQLQGRAEIVAEQSPQRDLFFSTCISSSLIRIYPFVREFIRFEIVGSQ